MAEQIIYCSFCHESQHDLEVLITGPEANICNKCVDICIGLIGEVSPEKTDSPAAPSETEKGED